jgi:hypothetical protein
MGFSFLCHFLRFGQIPRITEKIFGDFAIIMEENRRFRGKTYMESIAFSRKLWYTVFVIIFT